MQNIDPIPQEFKQYGGAKESPKDSRDISFGAILQPVTLPSWKEGSGLKKYYDLLERHHQGKSYSCVAFAFSKYLEMLNLIETELATDLSPKFIYEQIHLRPNSAYIRDGASLCVKKGDCEEKYISSYLPNGNPATEEYMQSHTPLNKEILANAFNYHSKSNYAFIADGKDFEMCRQAIYQFKGFVSGFSAHAVYFCDWGEDENGKYLIYFNSYGKEFGENGLGRYYFNNPNRLFDITVLVDEKNINKNLINKTLMKKRILYKGDQFINEDKYLSLIPDVPTLELLLKLKIVSEDMQEVDTLNDYQVIDALPSVVVSNKMREILPQLEDALKFSEGQLESQKITLISRIKNLFGK